eukprot:2201927-Rhodomonas_salina.1
MAGHKYCALVCALKLPKTDYEQVVGTPNVRSCLHICMGAHSRASWRLRAYTNVETSNWRVALHTDVRVTVAGARGRAVRPRRQLQGPTRSAYHICLRARYVMSGTNLGYGGTRPSA